MRKSYFIVGAFGLSMLLNACEKKVEIQLPYEGDKIVVNSLIQPDSVVYIRVTRSVPSKVFDDAGYKDIPDAAVSLTANGVSLPLQLQTIKGLSYYVSGEKAVLGQQYRVAVTAPGLKPVTGTDTLVAAPLANAATAQRNSNRVQFTLKDRAASADYYRIRIYRTDAGSGQVTFLLFRLDPAFNNNLVDFFSKGNYNSLIMSDERFNGKPVNFVLQTADPLTGDGDITVEVSALTRSSYLYFNTLAAQKESGNALVGNPARVFTNITDGYGIVGGINTKRMTFKIE
ncbi:DUF4249 domain-containing protein [Chitinophaga arvensicola]|uniref:DUF4249 domain-containing protein n=1 Tax=Chitinophaga arvensicola TaxID=29529 RepID=A0A1I0QGF3_9BACT|nr:DUF4249 domain-containing protein [Chitinophaga arvensicola]SEW26183.1 protein of unknown function [Chitinophaga arvensicola]